MDENMVSMVKLYFLTAEGERIDDNELKLQYVEPLYRELLAISNSPLKEWSYLTDYWRCFYSILL